MPLSTPRTRRSRLRAVSLTIAVIVTAVASSAAARPMAVGGDLIAFESLRDGQAEIYVMQTGGTGQRNLTNHPARDADPSWEPPADTCPQTPAAPKRIAFESDRGPRADSDIYILTLDSDAEPVNVTADATTAETAPAWGERNLLAYTRSLDRNREIYVKDLAVPSAQPVRLTDHAADDANPEWAPWRGRYLAFESTRSGEREIWMMQVLGTDGRLAPGPPYRVTHGGQAKRNPTWVGFDPRRSPEELTPAHRLAYTVEQDGGSYLDLLEDERPSGGLNAFVPFETAETPAWLTGDPEDDGRPSWEPDGIHLLLDRRAPGGGADVYQLRFPATPQLPDAALVRLTTDPADDRNADRRALTQCTAIMRPRRPRPRPGPRTPRRTDAPSSPVSPLAPDQPAASAPAPPTSPSAAPPSAPAAPRSGGESPRPARRPRCTVTGTKRADVLRGTRRRDVICGGAGDDRLIGGSGNDRLEGGSGNDRLVGGSGNDRLVGGSGHDFLSGGSGDDDLLARDGRPDVVAGGSGVDSARVDRRRDRVRGVERRRR